MEHNEALSHGFFKAVLDRDPRAEKQQNDEGAQQAHHEDDYGSGSESSFELPTNLANMSRFGEEEEIKLRKEFEEQRRELEDQIDSLMTKMGKIEEDAEEVRSKASRDVAEATQLRQCVGYPLFFGLVDKRQNRLPNRLSLQEGLHVRQMALGGNHSLAVLGNGDVYVFGRGNEGQLGTGDFKPRPQPTLLEQPRMAKFVAAGGNHSFVVTQSNNVYAFGDNNCGQLGVGEDSKKIGEPTLVKGLPGGVDIIDVKTSKLHTLFLTIEGDIFACGRGSEFQLGTGERQDEWEPLPIVRLSHYVITQLAVGDRDSMVIAEEASNAQSVVANDENWPALVKEKEHIVDSITNKKLRFLTKTVREYAVCHTETDLLLKRLQKADALESIEDSNQLLTTLRLVMQFCEEGAHESKPERGDQLASEVDRLTKKCTSLEAELRSAKDEINHLRRRGAYFGDAGGASMGGKFLTSGETGEADDSAAEVGDGALGGEEADEPLTTVHDVSPRDVNDEVVRDGVGQGDSEPLAKADDPKVEADRAQDADSAVQQTADAKEGDANTDNDEMGPGGAATEGSKVDVAMRARMAIQAELDDDDEFNDHIGNDEGLEAANYQRSAQLSRILDAGRDFCNILSHLRSAGIAEISKTYNDDTAVRPDLSARKLIHISNARISDLVRDTKKKYVDNLEKGVDDEEPVSVLLNTFLDAAMAREERNHVIEGLLDDAMARTEDAT